MIARAAAFAGVCCAWLGCSSLGWSAYAAHARSASGAPLRVVASVDPPSVLFADPITAEVEVDYDPKAIAPASIRVRPSFIPYVSSSAPVIERPQSGVMRFRYSLVCVTDGCLPTSRVRRLRFEPVRVSALAGKRAVAASGSWPTLRVSSRLTASDLTGKIRFKHPTTPPSPEYRLAPGPLSGALIVAAALCALAAAAVAGPGLARLPLRSSKRRQSPLELAIAYVRDSTSRPDPDRRRALELLAEAVGEDEPALAAAAADTAWSEAPPTRDAASELADLAASPRRGAG
jgi:hypothetical protein